MHLFSRSIMLTGPMSEIMTYATDMRAYASDLTGQEVALWAASFGAPQGSVTYALRVDGLAGVSALNAKLVADEGYLAKAEAGRQYLAGPREDTLTEIIHGQLGDDPPPVGSVATITQAVIGSGYADAIGWGVEVAQLVESVTGMPVMFGSSMFGTFGSVGWIGVAADAAAADTANATLLANADYINKVSAANDLFVPGSGHRIFTTRIA